MFRLLLLASVVVAAMALVKDGRVMREAGLFGSCSVVHSSSGAATHWRACKSGRLSGKPDLSHQSCKRWGELHGLDYWRCEASITAAYKP
jgi:hypothetical protein